MCCRKSKRLKFYLFPKTGMIIMVEDGRVQYTLEQGDDAILWWRRRTVGVVSQEEIDTEAYEMKHDLRNIPYS